MKNATKEKEREVWGEMLKLAETFIPQFKLSLKKRQQLVVLYSVNDATLHDRHPMIHIWISWDGLSSFFDCWSHKSVASWLIGG